jgi:Transcriptional regulator
MSRIDNTKSIILIEAKKLFDKFGYNKTSMDDIAKRAHKTKGSIYYNFEGKLEIYKSIINQEFETIKANLKEACVQKESDKKETGPIQIKRYLLKRMELFNNATVYKQMMAEQYLNSKQESIEVAQSIRNDFDKWEWDYFYKICSDGIKNNALITEIKPESFADMLQMVLKGLELQFFGKKDYENSKLTYECMINILMGNLTTPVETNTIK